MHDLAAPKRLRRIKIDQPPLAPTSAKTRSAADAAPALAQADAGPQPLRLNLEAPGAQWSDQAPDHGRRGRRPRFGGALEDVPGQGAVAHLHGLEPIQSLHEGAQRPPLSVGLPVIERRQ